MPLKPQFLFRPILRPSLTWASIIVLLTYPALLQLGTPWSLVAAFLGFYISLRVLIFVGHPPEGVMGSIFFALHLLNLLAGLLVVLFTFVFGVR